MKKTLLGSLSALLVLGAASGALATPSTPLVLPALNTPFVTGTLQARARATLLARSPALSGIELSHIATFDAGGGRKIVKFAQQHLGIPVLDRGAAVLLDAQGQPTSLATARTVSSFPSSATPGLMRDQALPIASKLAGIQMPDKHARLAWLPQGDSARLVWTFYAPVADGIPYAPVIVLDANTGELIERYNAVVFDRQASVNEFNPVKTPTPTTVTLSDLAQASTNLTDEHVKVMNCIDNQTTKTFYGITVHSCELQQNAVADSNGDFTSYTRGIDTAPEDSYAEVSMFYQVSKAYDYLQSLGMPDLQPAQLPAIVNLRLPDGMMQGNMTKAADPSIPLVPFDNAFFSPQDPMFSTVFNIQSGAMWFGQGTYIDFSYDGNVVYHEFTHAMIDRTIKLVGTWHLDSQGAVDSPGAMNEGLADFFSSAITGDGQVGEYASKGLTTTGAIRNLDNKDTCPAGLSGEVHADSTFFSGGLWAVRKTLSAAEQTEYDKAILAALMSAPSGDLGYGDLEKLFSDSIKASSLGQTVADALDAEMKTRGVSPSCNRVFEWADQPINGPDAQLMNSFSAPGRPTVGLMQSAAYAPGLFQVHVALPAGATKLTVSWKDVSAGGGSGSPFGQQGTPYTPAILARFGDATPLDFADGTANNATGKPTAPASGATSVDLDVPAGATDAYVMLVNQGDQDGRFKGFTVSVQSNSGAGGAGGAGGAAAGGAAGAAGAGGAAGANNAAPANSSSGCGCHAAGSEHPASPLGLLALAGLGLVFVRRRR